MEFTNLDYEKYKDLLIGKYLVVTRETKSWWWERDKKYFVEDIRSNGIDGYYAKLNLEKDDEIAKEQGWTIMENTNWEQIIRNHKLKDILK